MASGTTNFPTSLDSNAVADNTTQITSTGYNNHSVQIEALEAKVGVDSSAVTSSHDYKLSEVTSTDKAVGKTATQTLTNKTLTSPTINTPTFSDGAIVPKNLVTGTGTSWAWQSWTPTWSNLTIGNATQLAKYIQIGKTVFFRISITFGSTSSMGTSPEFTLPVNLVSGFDSTNYMVGTATYIDPDTVTVNGTLIATSATNVRLRVYKADGTYLNHANLTASVPHTWGNLDRIALQGHYEGA